MSNFVSGFISGFAVGFFVMVIISIIFGILAIISLTMEASDLPRPWFSQHPFNTRISLALQSLRAMKRWLR